MPAGTAACLFLLVVLFPSLTWAGEPLLRSTQWIGEVLLGSESGSIHRRCCRWVVSPTLSTTGATAAQQRATDLVVAQLNEVLRETSFAGIRLIAPERFDARILVRFAPLAEIPRLARRHGSHYQSGNYGWFHIWKDSHHQHTRAVVFIASDKLQGETLQHFLLEEIAQCLGTKNDSSLDPESIFYSGDYRRGDPVELSANDRKLLQFLYRYVKPGMEPAELAAAVDAHWNMDDPGGIR